MISQDFYLFILTHPTLMTLLLKSTKQNQLFEIDKKLVKIKFNQKIGSICQAMLISKTKFKINLLVEMMKR